MADINDVLQYLVPSLLVTFLFCFCCAVSWSKQEKPIQVVKRKEIDL